MKNALLIAILFSSGAWAQTANLSGVFAKRHLVAIESYSTHKTCKASGGNFRKGLCLFKAADSVQINQGSDGNYSINFQSIGHNAHLCQFTAKAELLNPVQLLAKGDDGCEIVVGLQNPTTAAVWNNGHCNSYCGGNMSPILDGATKTKN